MTWTIKPVVRVGGWLPDRSKDGREHDHQPKKDTFDKALQDAKEQEDERRPNNSGTKV